MKRSLVCLAAMLLTGCPSPATNPKATGQTEVKSSVTAGLRVGLTGVVHGFGDGGTFKASDAAKTKITLQNEDGQAPDGAAAVSPDSGGGFEFQLSTSGSFFALVTLPGGATEWSLLRTDSNGDNFISPGTTLACTWAKDQLTKKLVFLGDLPYAQMLQAGTAFDSALAANGLTLEADDAARLAQVTTLTGKDAGAKADLDGISKLLDTRAIANEDHAPAFVTDKQYAAKKAALAK